MLQQEVERVLLDVLAAERDEGEDHLERVVLGRVPRAVDLVAPNLFGCHGGLVEEAGDEVVKVLVVASEVLLGRLHALLVHHGERREAFGEELPLLHEVPRLFHLVKDVLVGAHGEGDAVVGPEVAQAGQELEGGAPHSQHQHRLPHLGLGAPLGGAHVEDLEDGGVQGGDLLETWLGLVPVLHHEAKVDEEVAQRQLRRHVLELPHHRLRGEPRLPLDILGISHAGEVLEQPLDQPLKVLVGVAHWYVELLFGLAARAFDELRPVLLLVHLIPHPCE
mmetsp:Transcript_1041/g.2616  ORF Transcript_1041/g.2616 Transcript_1041/m.2616 type:complete len:278 (-) Transcript_1041:1251-2084(-)